MHDRAIQRLRVIRFAVCMAALSGCTKPEPEVVHHVVPANEGYRLGCRRCYDEMVRVLTGPPKHRRYKNVLRHRCEECTSDVAFYVGEGDRLMIRCAHCAPVGMRCDRCLPPEPTPTPPASQP